MYILCSDNVNGCAKNNGSTEQFLRVRSEAVSLAISLRKTLSKLDSQLSVATVSHVQVPAPCFCKEEKEGGRARKEGLVFQRLSP